MLKTTADKQMH